MAELKGGDKLGVELAKLAASIGKPGTLRVGFLAGATYPGGTPVALIALIQDHGAPRAGIPPRPFFRNMIALKSPGWPASLAAILKSNGYNGPQALRLMGEGIKGQLQQSIKDTNSPPLAASTIKRKGHAKPLIDSSHMINSVDYEVT